MWSASRTFLAHLMRQDNLRQDQERLEVPAQMSAADRRWMIGSTLLILGVAGLWIYLMLWY